MSLFAKGIESPIGGMPAWPQGVSGTDPESRQWQNSTQFFKWVVTSGVMEVSFDFFSAEGTDKEGSIDPSKFNREDNAWAVTVGVNEDMDNGVPARVLFHVLFEPGIPSRDARRRITSLPVRQCLA